MNIRLAEKQDAPALIEFNQAMALETEGKHLDAQTLKSGVEAVFQDKKKGFTWLRKKTSKLSAV